MPFSLTIQDRYFNSEELKQTINTSSAFGDVFLFCKEWLSGQRDFVFQTSGSTGEPKPITVSRSQIKASITLTQRTFNLKENDSALLNLSTKHVGGKMMIARALEIGMHLTVVQADANPLKSLDKAFDFYSFVPLQLQNIIAQTPEKISLLNKAKVIIVGGAKVNIDLEKSLSIIESPVYATYGMTETLSHIAIKKLNGKNKDSLFKTLEGISTSVDERGCLRICGEVTGNNYIQTNDKVTIRGIDFELIGRIDNVINSGGLKVQAEKVELAVEVYFSAHRIKNRFFVAALPHSYFGEQVTLFIEGNMGNHPALLAYLATVLEKHEIPREILQLEQFAVTESGKLDKRKTIETIEPI